MASPCIRRDHPTGKLLLIYATRDEPENPLFEEDLQWGLFGSGPEAPRCVLVKASPVVWTLGNAIIQDGLVQLILGYQSELGSPMSLTEQDSENRSALWFLLKPVHGVQGIRFVPALQSVQPWVVPALSPQVKPNSIEALRLLAPDLADVGKIALDQAFAEAWGSKSPPPRRSRPR